MRFRYAPITLVCIFQLSALAAPANSPVPSRNANLWRHSKSDIVEAARAKVEEVFPENARYELPNLSKNTNTDTDSMYPDKTVWSKTAAEEDAWEKEDTEWEPEALGLQQYKSTGRRHSW
ncbi:hypothetical protein FRB94_006723 [Tulasnella sp. JGI-2019a]|nr:hypothetical protein FRB93_006138 [Tulasnella sp. JGI-2019a]KAG8998668.1 hypothetical protein FRB94_006723 [Tulasnella sp. JGI-2019a]